DVGQSQNAIRCTGQNPAVESPLVCGWRTTFRLNFQTEPLADGFYLVLRLKANHRGANGQFSAQKPQEGLAAGRDEHAVVGLGHRPKDLRSWFSGKQKAVIQIAVSIQSGNPSANT